MLIVRLLTTNVMLQWWAVLTYKQCLSLAKWSLTPTLNTGHVAVLTVTRSSPRNYKRTVRTCQSVITPSHADVEAGEGRAGVLSSVTPLPALTWRNKQRQGLSYANITNNVQFCNYKCNNCKIYWNWKQSNYCLISVSRQRRKFINFFVKTSISYIWMYTVYCL